MDLIEHLRAFVAVAEARSFTHAAEDAGVPQPVVSRRVMSLEKRLGDTLFSRAGHQVQITDLGSRLLPHAIDLVARADRFIDLAASAHQARVLRIGVPPEADPRRIASAVARARDAGFTLGVAEATDPQRRAQFEAGVLQIAFLIAPVDVSTMCVRLGVGDLGAPTSKPFHLDELRPSRRDDLGRRRRLIMTVEDAGQRSQVQQLMAQAGLSPVQLELAESVAGALTSVHADSDVILCTQQFALRHDLRWSRVGGTDILRGYVIEVRAPKAWHDQALALCQRIEDDLVDAVHATRTEELKYRSPRSLAPSGGGITS